MTLYNEILTQQVFIVWSSLQAFCQSVWVHFKIDELCWHHCWCVARTLLEQPQNKTGRKNDEDKKPN